MMFSSASVSAREVDEVAATAAGGGLRAGGGKAACRRVAGAKAGATGAGIATGAVFLAAALAAGAVVLAEVLSAEVLRATLRAIGRAFGSGTVGLAQASAATADNPTASARLVANAVDRNATARDDRVTAFLRGESLKRSGPRSISLNMWTKYLIHRS
jgi:hypothetical protein